jgi:putative glutamine amidotransferase
VITQRTRRPVVGIPTQTLQSLGGVSAEIPPSWVMSQRYILTLTTAGAIPWLIPLVDDATLRGIYERLDAVFLPGGADIDPATYGEAPHPATKGTWPERDEFEVALARRALERDIPLLGICRGMQLMNVARGGTLIQHLPDDVGHEDHRRVAGSFDGADHDVRLADGSLAARVAGEVDHATKSHHHQAVAQLGEGLVPSGWSTLDDLPEAIEDPERRFALGVQWHPEADPSSRLIASLVAEAAAARNGDRP